MPDLTAMLLAARARADCKGLHACCRLMMHALSSVCLWCALCTTARGLSPAGVLAAEAGAWTVSKPGAMTSQSGMHCFLFCHALACLILLSSAVLEQHVLKVICIVLPSMYMAYSSTHKFEHVQHSHSFNSGFVFAYAAYKLWRRYSCHTVISTAYSPMACCLFMKQHYC